MSIIFLSILAVSPIYLVFVSYYEYHNGFVDGFGPTSSIIKSKLANIKL